jgi:integrase
LALRGIFGEAISSSLFRETEKEDGALRKRRGRNEGAVFQRKDGRWCARADIGVNKEGRRVQIWAYGKTKQEALQQLAAKRQVPIGTRAVREQHLSDFLADFLTNVGIENSDATWSLRASTIKRHIDPLIGGMPVGRITTSIIRDLLLTLKQGAKGRKPCSDHTLHRVYATLHAAFQRAIDRGDLSRNPCRGCPKPKPKRKPRAILDLDETHQVLRTALQHFPRYFALLVLASTTAMRQGEIFGLRWEYVNLEKGWLDVTLQLAYNKDGQLHLKEPKTAKSKRRVELSEVAVAALRWHRKHFPSTSGLVFTTDGKSAIWKRNFAQRVLDPVLEMAGVRRVVFHELRHTVNSLLLEKGVSPVVMAEMLGHESTRMTLDVYGQSVRGSQRAAVEKTNELFPVSEIGSQLELGSQKGVKSTSEAIDLRKEKRPILNRIKRFQLVEMSGFEPLTPYMRSKCSTS